MLSIQHLYHTLDHFLSLSTIVIISILETALTIAVVDFPPSQVEIDIFHVPRNTRNSRNDKKNQASSTILFKLQWIKERKKMKTTTKMWMKHRRKEEKTSHRNRFTMVDRWNEDCSQYLPLLSACLCVCVPLYRFLSCARCIIANEHSWIYLSILNYTKEMILLVKRICSVNQTYASVSMMETRKLLLLKCFGWCETNSPVIMCVYSNSRQSRFVSLCTLYITFSIFHIIYNSMELKMIGNDSLLSAQLNCSKGTQLKLLYDMYVFSSSSTSLHNEKLLHFIVHSVNHSYYIKT